MFKNDAYNVNKEFASFICAITRDPISWQQWRCIDISIEHSDNEQDNKAALLCAQSLIKTYLSNKNIHSFLCAPHNLYVLCKHINNEELNELKDYITSMVRVEQDQIVYFQVYSLDDDLDAFLTKVQEQGDAGPLILPPLSQPPAYLYANKNTKALLVEDDPVTRWMVRNALKDECHLMTAATASEACTLYSSFRPDIVLLDIGLPDKSGTDVMEWILRNDPGARIVMFSGQDSLDSMTTALEAGAIGFVAKPFSRETLVNYVRQANKRGAVGH